MEHKQGTTRAPAARRRRSFVDDQSARYFRVTAAIIGWFCHYWIRRFRSIGIENVPAEGGYFLIANHRSALDPFLLSYPIRRRMPLGPGKAELFTNPVVAFVMRKLGIFPIHQESADPGAVRAMVSGYRHGHVVIVFPEGGRSDSGELMPFFPDFARLALKLRAPLIPAGIAGAADVLPVGAVIPRYNVPVVVNYGQPFDLSAYADRPLTPELAGEVAAYLRTRVATILATAEDERQRLAEHSSR